MPVRGVRRRYLYVKVQSVETISEDDFKDSLIDKVHFLYGVTGAADMNLRLIEWMEEDQAAIVRVRHTMLTEAKAALGHITEINCVKTRLDLLRVSGTIKSLKSKI